MKQNRIVRFGGMNMKKIITLLMVLVLITPVMFAADLASFTGALDGFLGEINDALPDSAVVGGTWSDAYIGQLVGVPPHFGIGIAAGGTRFPVAALEDAANQAGQELPTDTLFLPNFAIEARIGGFILPFDAGIRFGMVPSMTLKDITFEYFNIGGDIRYALMKDGLVKPDISIGLGYTYTSGKIGYTFDAGKLLGVDPSFGALKETLDTKFHTNVIEAKLQISKKLLIITPYAGLGVYSATSEASYTLVDETTTKTTTAIGTRVFGGMSLNLLLLKFDLSGMYNIKSSNWGVNFGTRIQL